MKRSQVYQLLAEWYGHLEELERIEADIIGHGHLLDSAVRELAEAVMALPSVARHLGPVEPPNVAPAPVPVPAPAPPPPAKPKRQRKKRSDGLTPATLALLERLPAAGEEPVSAQDLAGDKDARHTAKMLRDLFGAKKVDRIVRRRGAGKAGNLQFYWRKGTGQEIDERPPTTGEIVLQLLQDHGGWMLTTDIAEAAIKAGCPSRQGSIPPLLSTLFRYKRQLDRMPATPHPGFLYRAGTGQEVEPLVAKPEVKPPAPEPCETPKELTQEEKDKRMMEAVTKALELVE